ncbi:hypothetical protein EVAR_71260_1 [Eumeta japonica]|uniref:Uncharacterized protein n=1 Tax=Eumeta variegata TaxID=151549 RepID=A0A4C1ST70_EUMVA|nr:hypothetical protein EVAR_71260_1 [Eumeta japonica]
MQALLLGINNKPTRSYNSYANNLVNRRWNITASFPRKRSLVSARKRQHSHAFRESRTSERFAERRRRRTRPAGTSRRVYLARLKTLIVDSVRTSAAPAVRRRRAACGRPHTKITSHLPLFGWTYLSAGCN